MSDETLERYENWTLSDYSNGEVELVKLRYLSRMFDFVIVNERGKPIQIMLTEKPESFLARKDPSVTETE